MNNNVDKVFNYIQEKISTKEWDIGDKIASEIPLAKELGVSRSVVREAIKGFVALKILSRVQGGGTYVNSVNSNIYFNDIIPDTSLGLSGFLEVFEVRKALDPLTISLAIKEGNTHLLSDLMLIVEKMKKCKDMNKKFYECVIKFHQKIADYSRNKLLIKLYEVMTQLTEVYIRRNISTIEYNEKIIDEHEKILKQVEEEDVEVAKLYSLLYVEKVLSKV